ncbi:BnaCnng02870D [Brassica napus]|uniref:BnaCnng02870D protein n=1 Tax=Brassica napus TaxID=3708 RepID=A0A078FAE8_BRANA|nr:BnaCnng02870D [Brassica napus]
MGVYYWIQRIFCYFLDMSLRPVEIIGNLASIEKAEKLINAVGVIIGRRDYQEHADKVESTDSGCPFYL